MDLLAKRYASPCFLLDGMILMGKFSDFVDDIRKAEAEEEEQQKNWEFFLHRVYEGSYTEFLEGIENNKQHMNMSVQTIETTVQRSSDILNGFNPENGGE